MLFVSINLGGILFAIPAKDVIRVLPLIELRPVPQTPEFLAGIFAYQDRMVPVIDLQVLTHQQPCARRFSTRVILARPHFEEMEVKEIGILAERVTDAFEVDPDRAVESGVRSRGHDFLGAVVETGGRTYQIVHLDRILSKPMKEVLQREYRAA